MPFPVIPMPASNGQRAMFPAGPQSATAAAGKAKVTHQVIYSSIVCTHGGGAQTKMFTVPQGQTILSMKTSGYTIAATHHLVHSELTTSLEKAGELGTGIGNSSVRGISIVLEAAPVLLDSTDNGTYAAFGATPHDVADALAKLYFQLLIGGSKVDQGTLWMFPAAGGLFAGVSSTVNNSALGYASNGPMAGFPRKRVPIQISANDTIQGIVNTGNGATLDCKTQADPGQEFLLYCCLDSLLKAGVR